MLKMVCRELIKLLSKYNAAGLTFKKKFLSMDFVPKFRYLTGFCICLEYLKAAFFRGKQSD